MHTKRRTRLLIIGIIVITIGIIIGIIPFFNQKEMEKKENIKIKNYILDTSYNEKTSEIDKENTNEVDNKIDEESYLLIIEIPKIGLKKGVYPLNSKLNTIEKNVAIMKESSLPDKEGGNVVLEAHNGPTNISYFNQLHKLKINDQVYINYQGIKYTYTVSNIYDVEKDGSVEVNRDINKNTLTLITCKKNTTDRQLVVILYLSSKEKY